MGATQNVAAAVRVGFVESTKPAKATVRVRIPDLDNLISYDLQVVQRKARKDKDYWMPDLREEVLCLFLGNGLETGFVLGALHNEEDVPPVDSQDKRHIAFEDGTQLEYDRKAHKLTANVQGDIEVNATGNITVAAAGNVTITGARIDMN